MITKRFTSFWTMHMIIIILSALTMISCCAGPAPSPTARRLINDLVVINTRTAAACDTEIDQEIILINAMFVVRQITVRQRLLSDLDDLLSPSGEYDADLLQMALADPDSDNALVAEVRLGRLLLVEAQHLLGDHAQSAHLSDKLRQTIERETVATFTEVKKMKRMHAEMVQALQGRKRGLERMKREVNYITEALTTPVWDGEKLLSLRESRLRTQMMAVSELVGDDRVRSSLQLLIDAAYPSDQKAITR